MMFLASECPFQLSESENEGSTGHPVLHSCCHKPIRRPKFFHFTVNILLFSAVTFFYIPFTGCSDNLRPSVVLSAGQCLPFGDLSVRSNAVDDFMPQGNCEWRDDVGQRYSELKPPQRKRCAAPQPMIKGELLRKLSQEKIRSLLSEVSRLDSSRIDDCQGMMLDLDKTCLFGNDGNDLGIALQWMDRTETQVQELYRLLVNPALHTAFKSVAANTRQVKVAIYTMRASLLYYRSNFRGIMIPLKFSPEWHVDGQLILPPDVRTTQDVMNSYSGPFLTEDERVDIHHSMQRLLAARDAIQWALGLSAPPTVVVTASGKDVSRTAATLGFPEASTFLWDDNPTLVGRAGVVPVPPYDVLAAKERDLLGDFLSRNLPAEGLDEDLLDFMASAHPGESVLSFREGPNGLVPTWSLPLAPTEVGTACWPVPHPSLPLLPSGSRGSSKAACDWGCGCLSPVTPVDGVAEDAAVGSGASAAHLDGRRPLVVRRGPT